MVSIFSYEIFGIITALEILYLIITTLVIGYIFTGNNPLFPNRFNLQEFYFAALSASPGIILHELAHKFVAMSFGYPAHFEIFPFGIAIAILLKLMNSPLLFIAPGFVNIPAVSNTLDFRIIAFVGPGVNLLLWLTAYLVLRYSTKLSRKQLMFWALTKRINLILFIFNMIPFGPLDGAKVFFGN